MKKLLALTVLITLTGCSSSLSKLAKELKNDPATITIRMGTPWGNQSLTRVGGQTNSVEVAPDGTVRINPR